MRPSPVDWTHHGQHEQNVNYVHQVPHLIWRLTSHGFVTPQHILSTPRQNGPPNTRGLSKKLLGLYPSRPNDPHTQRIDTNSGSYGRTSSSIPGGHVPTTRRPQVLHHTSRPQGPARLLRPLNPGHSREPSTPSQVLGLLHQELSALAQRHLPHVSAQHIPHGRTTHKAITLGLDPPAPEVSRPLEQHELSPAPA